MQRKLASIQVIEELKEIPQFDKLVYAKILGWNALVKKEEFQVGEKIIYIEYDSILPNDSPEFSFMESRKFLVKSIKMRGVLSQGLVFPISLLEKFGMTSEEINKLELGEDVTEVLRIIKYEVPDNIKLGFSRNNMFPSFLPKTDEIRIQSCPKVIQELDENESYYITLKEDGSSATYYLKTKYKEEEIHFGVCSRNLESNEFDPFNAYWKIAKEYDLEHKLKTHFENTQEELAIQGEIAGPGMNGSGVRKNAAGYNKVMFKVFNVYSITQKRYYDFEEMVELVNQLNLVLVDQLDPPTPVHTWSMQEWIDFAGTTFYPQNKLSAEGIVVRPKINRYSPTLKDRLSFKVINNNFLLSK